MRLRRSLNIFLSFTLSVLGVIVALSEAAWACPDIDGMIDWNCDGKLIISAFGDSITYGIGDGRRLGYPGRLRKLLPNTKIYNFGDPGEKTSSGKSRAGRKFRKASKADFTIILEGVNDYWQEDHSPYHTRDNLLDIVRSAEDEGAIAILSKLTSVRRSFQIGWVLSVNSVIKRDKHTRMDFYSLGTRIIGPDKLHPNARGYQSMAKFAQGALIKISERDRPRDADQDGIYDFAEKRFGTSTKLSDSDGDGLLDGDEVFKYKTSPINRDSDGDGIEDGVEVGGLNSNPGSSKPGAPTLQSIEIMGTGS